MGDMPTITEADILSEVVAPDQPGISREFAQSIVELQFTDKATRRIQALLEENNAGTIDKANLAELNKYLRVGQFLDLLQAKAHLSLQQADLAD